MLSMELDVVQDDCPYIHASERQDVEFFVNQWDFDPAAGALETRILVSAGDREALDLGLDELRDHDNMREFELLRRKGQKGLLRSTIGETQAMESIRTNDGYITGPFDIRDGSEIWRVGFDTQTAADSGLADLDRHNDYTVESRKVMDLDDFHALVQNIDAARGFLDGCTQLSDVERETLQTAVETGYFERPRDATLGRLAELLDVSKAAVSKNLRRTQRKVLRPVVDVLDSAEEMERPESPR